MLVVGLGGCWGWRGRIGKEIAPNGVRIDVKGPLPDLDVCNGRRVYVLLDTNVATNPKVGAAEKALIGELCLRSSDARVCTLPQIDAVNGPDDFIALGDEAMDEVFSASVIPPTTKVSALLNDTRPHIMLPADDYLLADFAAELGKHVRGLLFRHNREAVLVEGAAMRAIGAQELRTLAEQRVICCKAHTSARMPITVGRTMSVDDARGVLPSFQFLDALDPLRSVENCRMPVMRANGRIELLSNGYDAATQTFTIPSVEFPDEMPFVDALKVLYDLFSEFEFADDGRSLAVAVAALIGLYSQQLLPVGTLRPVFIYTKNAEGAGATTAVACAVVPVFGESTTSVKPDEDAEMRKLFTSALREGRRVVVFDNVKSKIGGAALEAFTTGATWRDRLLSKNETISIDNNATVFVTGNGAVVTPDMRRRSLFCELHLSLERAEDRSYVRPLNLAVLRAMRPRILAACWSVIKHWDAAGRPQPSRSHSAFPEWATVIGGIVEAAGFACPFDTPIVSTATDEDGDGMRQLAAAMTLDRQYEAAQLYALCRNEAIFTELVGLRNGEMDRSHLSKMGRLLASYNGRIVGSRRFVIEGIGHAKRFSVKVALHGNTVEHGVPLQTAQMDHLRLEDGNTMQTMQTMQPANGSHLSIGEYHEELL